MNTALEGESNIQFNTDKPVTDCHPVWGVEIPVAILATRPQEWLHKASKSYEHIFQKFSGNVNNGTRNK